MTLKKPFLYYPLIMIALMTLICLSSPCHASEQNDFNFDNPVTLDQIPSTMKNNPDYEYNKCTGIADDTKVIPLLVIVVGFNNVDYEKNFDWNEQLFNSANSGEPRRTLQQYYLDMSYNQMTFVPVKEDSAYKKDGNSCIKDTINDGIVHVRVPVDHKLWPTDADTDSPFPSGQVLQQAEKYVDFSRYDLNRDDNISENELAIVFVLAGYNSVKNAQRKYPFGKSLYLHPFFDQETIPFSDGRVKKSKVCIPEQSELECYDYAPTITPMGIFAHELAHHLGIQDFYYGEETPDIGWEAYQPDYLSLMSSGNYGETLQGDPRPFSLDIWSRIRLGWIKPVLMQANTPYQLTSAGTVEDNGKPRALRINTIRENEYYLLENRQFESWDQGLGRKIGAEKGGIILWHVYESEDNPTGALPYITPKSQPGLTPVYREEDANGKVSLIGTKVLHQYPFFDQTIQKTAYSEVEVNGYLNLPLYPKNILDEPFMRKYSCTGITFSSESGKIMTVEMNPENHNWDEGRVTKEATQNEEGIRTFTCLYCKTTKTEAIDKLSTTSEDQKNPETKGRDGTAFGQGASLSLAEKTVLSQKSNMDPAGTKLFPLCVKSTRQANSSVTVTWNKVSGARKYIIYGNAEGKAMLKLKQVTAAKANISTIGGKKLAKKTYYKFMVIAVDGKDKVVSSSKIVHVATKGGKVGNYKSIKTAAKKNKVVLKKGKKFKLKAKALPVSKKLKVKSYRKIQYESSAPAIASVSKKGVVKGRKKGSCKIYIYLQNGITKVIKITVR